MIPLKAIRSEASSQSYTRGNTLYKTGMIERFTCWNDGRQIMASAHVEGSYDNCYEVNLVYDTQKEEFVNYDCECPAYYSYDGMCKHCVAVALELQERVEDFLPGAAGEAAESDGTAAVRSAAALSAKLSAEVPARPSAEAPARPSSEVPARLSADVPAKSSAKSSGKTSAKIKKTVTSTAVKNLIYARSIREKARYFQPEMTGNVRLEPIIHHKINEWQIEFKIGVNHLYVLKNITDFVKAMRNREWIEYGQKLKFYHEMNVFTEKSQRLIAFLTECIDAEEDSLRSLVANGHYYYYSAATTSRYLQLTEDRMVRLADALGAGNYVLTDAAGDGKLQIENSDPALLCQLEPETGGGYRIRFPKAEVFYSRAGLCVCKGNVLYRCGDEFAGHMGEICSLMQPYKEIEYDISEEDLPSFCASILPELESYTVLRKTKALDQYRPKPCAIAVYLDYIDGNLTGNIYADYGETRCNLLEDLKMQDLYRDIEKERVVMGLAEKYFTCVDTGENLLFIPEEDEEAQYNMISTGIIQFQQAGEVYITDALKRLRVLSAPKITMGVAMKSGLLDITLQTGELAPGELEALLDSYRKRKKYYRLENGDFLELEQNGLSAVAELAEGLDLDSGDLENGHILIPEYRSFYLDQVLRENEGTLQIRRDQSFKAFLRTMKNVEDSDYDVPAGLHAELRSYQKFGFRWLMTLHDLGFGGILADDMGLGKTIQAIAYLTAMKEREAIGRENGNTVQNHFRSLIVCPASLVYNWESEINHFAPDLTVQTVVGNAGVRSEKIHQSEPDVLLTSYDLLKRDVEEYHNITFDAMFIDEAQNIKNHTTQTAKAVKAIAADHRFALTGTPIENTLSELWSIFDFLMPGFLNTYKKFRERCELPIVAKQDEIAAERLRKMIRPFILRRLKKDVLKELPDKLEEVVYSRMEDDQRKIYEANVQNVLNSLAGQTSEEFRTNRIQILAELTRLRQLCCDPSLVYENYTGGAAKVDTCVELIRNAVEAGNKLLVFSQFTSMLDIVKKRLEEEKIGYYILTGSTTKEKRRELVEAFNRDQTPVFLISLKAGGTGLNLTAASIVIHFDPWWNMAAQNQATDRAHRIGQTSVVTVYKLIMKDTLEEKILKLQEKKAGLSEEIISEGSVGEIVKSREEFLELLGEIRGDHL